MTNLNSGGCWVAIEGIDNVGKTTLAHSLVDHLGKNGNVAKLEPEFGALEFGQLIQSLVYTNWGIVPTAAQQFVIAADRSHRYLDAAEFAESGGAVVFDRHLMSSAVYQGVAAKRPANEVWLSLKNLYGQSFRLPDITFVLDASIETAVERGGDDVQTIEFLNEARGRFLDECNGTNVHKIDAEMPVDAVFDEVLKHLSL